VGLSRLKNISWFKNSLNWKKIKNLIYPEVNSKNMVHRIIFVVGWLLFGAIIIGFIVDDKYFFRGLTEGVVIGIGFGIIYFGVFQRIIYYIIYGEDKNKWLKENNYEK
jgi:hypothetical protein